MTEVVMNVHLPQVDPSHSAFQAALAELIEDLETVPSLRLRNRDLPDSGGSKGALTELVISLSTSGGAAAAVKIMQLWLARDRRRSLKVTVQTDQNKTTYEISGEDISVDALKGALEAAVRTRAADDTHPDSSPALRRIAGGQARPQKATNIRSTSRGQTTGLAWRSRTSLRRDVAIGMQTSR